MNPADIIIVIILAALVGFIIWRMIRRRKSGKGSCSCGCGGCSTPCGSKKNP